MQEEVSCRSGVASDAPCGIFELKKAGTGHRGPDRRLQLRTKKRCWREGKQACVIACVRSGDERSWPECVVERPKKSPG